MRKRGVRVREGETANAGGKGGGGEREGGGREGKEGGELRFMR